jgi:DNA-binding CsgD family transcriptional regulator
MASETELSEREKEILRLAASGASNKEIALALSISPNTVKVHLRNVFAKIGAVSRTEAALIAVRMGLVDAGAVRPAPPAEDGPPGAAEEPTLAITEEIPAEVKRSPRLAWWAWAGLALAGLVLLAALAAGGMALAQVGPFSPPPTPTLAPTPPPAVVAASESRWSEVSALPAGRSGLAAAVFEGAIYAIGGATAQGPSPATLRYRQSSAGWEALADKPTPVTEIQAAVLGERIYVPGGKDAGGKPVSLLEVYAPRQNRWERLASLPAALSGYALAAYEGRLYLFGGWDGAGYSAAVYSYDPAADRWETRTPLPSPRAFAAAALVESKIYVMGGFDGQQALRANLAYFPGRDHASAGSPAATRSAESPWEERAPLPEARYAMASTTITSLVYLVGGQSEGKKAGELGSAQYQTMTDRWASFERAPGAVGARPAMVALDTRLHVLGGQSGPAPDARHQIYQAIYTILMPNIQQ